MRVGVATIHYNNFKELRRLARTLTNRVHKWILIDGIFKYTADKNPELTIISNDGSREYFKTTPNKNIAYETLPLAFEYEKRNLYLMMAGYYSLDVLIIVDSDEFFIYPQEDDEIGSWIKFIEKIEAAVEYDDYKHNVYSINTVQFLDNGEVKNVQMPRIWFKPGQMRYLYGSHYFYGNVETERDKIEYYKTFKSTYQQPSKKVIDGIYLGHSHFLRDDDSKKLREDYGRYLKVYEPLVQSQRFTPVEAHEIALNDKQIDVKALIKSRKNLSKSK